MYIYIYCLCIDIHDTTAPLCLYMNYKCIQREKERDGKQRDMNKNGST